MGVKCLKRNEDTEKEKVLKISGFEKEQFYSLVREQQNQTAKLPGEFDAVSGKINRSGYLILRTAYRIDEYYRTEFDIFEENEQIIELSEFISAICEKSEPVLQKKNLGISFILPSEKLYVKANGEKFCYAVLELLLNAAENSASGTKIIISLTAKTKYAKITVSDKGKGIKKELICGAFEKNFGKNCKNLGIGLLLVSHFAKENSGKFQILSIEGKGTKAAIYLPISFRGAPQEGVCVTDTKILGEKFSPADIMLSAIETD